MIVRYGLATLPHGLVVESLLCVPLQDGEAGDPLRNRFVVTGTHRVAITRCGGHGSIRGDPGLDLVRGIPGGLTDVLVAHPVQHLQCAPRTRGVECAVPSLTE